MSIEVIKSQIDKFLSNETPEVMAIKGKWGIGKTYSWNKFLLEAKGNDRIAFKKYSYVSLFGINSLDAFKYAIFEQIVDRDLIGREANIETFKNNIISTSTASGRALLDLFKSKSTTHAIESLAFLSLSNIIICIDDLERKGKGLDIKDVLGLVSLLKEQKKCKVVLLLNDGEEGVEDYIKYREKVIDFELEFSPTAEESAEIAFTGTELDDYVVEVLKESSIKLNIRNIRILKKIERLVKLVFPYLHEYEQEITHQVVSSLAFFSWCYYCQKSDGAPPLDFVITQDHFAYAFGIKEEESDEDKKWRSIINNYGYQYTDELDLLLSRSVQTGYFIEQEVKAKATKKNEEIIASKSEGSFSSAWDLYHNNFDDNQTEVVTGLYDSFKNNTKYIKPHNLDGTVSLFRELGKDDKAEEIIDLYINARKEEVELFDPDSHFFGIKDKSMREKFNATHQSFAICKTAEQVLECISEKDGWNQKDEVILSNTSVEKYYEIFKSTKGRCKLSSFINACLRFGQFANSNAQQKEIANRATEALKRIAKESEINKSRVALYGIQLDDA